MKTLATAAAQTRNDTRGIAAVEFAILAPSLMLMLGCLVDYSLALWSRGVLANSVAQGMRYAFLVGEDVTAANVRTVVQKTLSLPAASVVVTGPNCYCNINTPPAVALLCKLPGQVDT